MKLNADTLDILVKRYPEFTEEQIVGIIWAISRNEDESNSDGIEDIFHKLSLEITVGYKWITFFQSNRLIEILVAANIYKKNIVKTTSDVLNLKYKELGEKIGYEGNSLRNIASKPEVSTQLTKAIELYLETLDLKNTLKDCIALKNALKNLIK